MNETSHQSVSLPVELKSSSAPIAKPLQIGLLVDSFLQPRWVGEVIKDIQASDFARIALIVKNDAGQNSAARASAVKRMWANRKTLLYAAYTKLDNQVFKVKRDAFAPVDVRELVGDCQVIHVTPVQKKFSDYLLSEDIERIRAVNLDVAWRLGFRILRGEALNIAREGVWSYHHGDALVNRGSPPAFWEVMRQEPVVGSVLQVLTEELDNGKVLQRSWATMNELFSVKRARNNLYWKSSAFFLRKLKELAKEGAVTAAADETLFRPYTHRIYKTPTNSEMIPLLTNLSGRVIRKTAFDLTGFEQWILAYRLRKDAHDSNDAFYKFKYLIPPKERFWADPFPVKWQDKYYIFFEDYVYATNKAHISAVEIKPSGEAASQPLKVLECAYHLSYPFLFEWKRNLYMIPETSANRTIEVYRCTRFPDEWQLEKVLMSNVRAADATLYETGGRWWMFVNIAADDYSLNYDELYVFHAASPFDEWQPINRNPAKSDVRNARPAGRPFMWRGELYRPAQDSSHRYGNRIAINKVTRLDAGEYQEQQVWQINADWDARLIGVHTLNSWEDLTVIDCLWRRGKFRS